MKRIFMFLCAFLLIGTMCMAQPYLVTNPVEDDDLNYFELLLFAYGNPEGVEVIAPVDVLPNGKKLLQFDLKDFPEGIYWVVGTPCSSEFFCGEQSLPFIFIFGDEKLPKGFKIKQRIRGKR